MPKQLSQKQSSRRADKKVLPLKEFFLDDTHYDSEKLEIFWFSTNRIAITGKDDERPIFGPFAMRDHVDELIVS
jgi:hypothetical protein